MKRLTTETPKDNLEMALNLFYIKDHETWVRGYGPAPEYADVSLFDLTRDIVKTHIPDVELPAENAALRRMIDNLTSAQAVMVREFEAKLEELAKVKAERDAAVHDLHGECSVCEHVDTDCPAMECRNGEKFKWRGPQKEGT